jgi:hypothetical protein
METCATSFQSQPYPLVNYVGTEHVPHNQHSSEHLKSLAYDPSHNVTDQAQVSSTPATVCSISAVEGYSSLGCPDTQLAGTSSYRDFDPSSFDKAPLQRFEAERVDDQPYNSISSFRTIVPGSNIMSQSQPSLNIAYNGSDSDFCASEVDNFRV